MLKGKFVSFALAAAAVLVASAPLSAEAQQQPEMRARWVSRFEWPADGTAATQANIRSIFDELVANNFNTVIFQIRGECNTLYPSPYEPWGPQFNWTDPGWDPLQFALDEAHARGLEFHAYINTHTIASTIPPSTTSPQHLYNLHGPSAAESWAIHDANGNPVGVEDAYVWMSPGVPEASAWTRRAIMHVVDNYDIDGLHFDRIRTPGPEYSRDPITLSRFSGEGNPDALAWGDFMRSQITRDLRKIYGATMLRKPHIKLSAAPFGICYKVPDGYQGTGTESYYSWYQDSFGWMEGHVLDCLFPQIYWEIGSAHPFEVLLTDFSRRDGGRHIYAGINARNDEVAQIAEVRNQGELGNTIWPGGTIDYTTIRNTLYTEAVDTPEMPWKTNPQHAIVVGTVTDFQGNEVVDCVVNITGDSYNYLTAFDGFYSILDIDPGTVTISAEKSPLGRASQTVTVAAGDVIEVNLVLSTSAGTVSFDRDEYLAGETATLTVVDSDIAGDGTVSISLSSTVDSESLTLNEITSGVFEGMIALSETDGPGVLAIERDTGITATYQDADNGSGPATATDTASISPYVVIYDEPMDDDPQWATEGQWAFGQPTGGAGDHGGPDPTSGYTGENVYGYNLAGGYANDMAQTEYLTTEPIDCSGGQSTIIRFQRWLQVESSTYDSASVEISSDGTNWVTVWSNPATTIEDTSWQAVEVDVSSEADLRNGVQFRWGMGPTDVGWTYAGWNVDDFQVLQIPGFKVDFIIDNDEPGFVYTGEWELSTFGNNYGDNKRYLGAADPTAGASWEFTGIPSGTYSLSFWVNDNAYAADAEYTVWDDAAPVDGTTVVASQENVGDGWHALGEYEFTGGTALVELSGSWTQGGQFLVADAMRLESVTVEEPAFSSTWILH